VSSRREAARLVPAVAGQAAKTHFLGLYFAKFQKSRLYDPLMRLPMLMWSVPLAGVATTGLVTYMREAEPASEVVFAINVAMRLATIAFLILLATATAARMRPLSQARGIEPRLTALLGTLLPSLMVLFPRYELSATAGVISTLVILIGNTLAAFVLGQLGRSFSVMAEVRQLITSGVYGFVRHPLYLAEEVAALGVYMQYLSTWTTLLMLAQFAFQLRRMRDEEALLLEAFPDYLPYQKSTARLIPGVY
jgi:protein-S-isoprenylcysteine O-methyltransferase Ste14